ncbi:DNA-protecting protein DprA [Legionella israelensis]|uniref:DNA-processing protein DprA n=1 Tax=Legionella israelensis TaxID=454 RepID=UPI001180C69C|nr:DNA-processing protein DprA [Legionella israelensis]QDP73371.1 DNA-protecting protein DprA [Legionella israelensis]
MRNLRFFLALNRIPKLGPRSVMKLLQRWPDLKEMFSLSAHQLEKEGLPFSLAEAIAHFDFRLVDADFNWSGQDDHHILTWEDKEYPQLLKEIHDPPVVLYAIGQLSCLQQSALAMVGSRNPSVTGSENAEYFARELAARDMTIVSGLALGIDAQAHRGCLAAEGKTIAVMRTGIDHIYPKRHHGLAQDIRKNGLLLSEFPLKSPPTAGHFPRRNRIISGLSLATLVVEAAVKSGSLITARFALEQNRDVLAIPGSIHNPKARGCHYLLKQGARLVTSVEDIMDELNMEKQVFHQKTHPLKLANSNEKLVKCIGFEMTTIDQIIVRSGLEVEQVTCGLADLELEGIVKAVPGGYMRC